MNNGQTDSNPIPMGELPPNFQLENPELDSDFSNPDRDPRKIGNNALGSSGEVNLNHDEEPLDSTKELGKIIELDSSKNQTPDSATLANNSIDNVIKFDKESGKISKGALSATKNAEKSLETGGNPADFLNEVDDLRDKIRGNFARGEGKAA